jgi:hypothetical protein
MPESFSESPSNMGLSCGFAAPAARFFPKSNTNPGRRSACIKLQRKTRPGAQRAAGRSPLAPWDKAARSKQTLKTRTGSCTRLHARESRNSALGTGKAWRITRLTSQARLASFYPNENVACYVVACPFDRMRTGSSHGAHQGKLPTGIWRAGPTRGR